MKLRILPGPEPQHLALFANRIKQTQPVSGVATYFMTELRLPEKQLILQFKPAVKIKTIRADNLDEHALRLLYSLCFASSYSHRTYFEPDQIYTLELDNHETHYIYLVDRIMLRERSSIKLEKSNGKSAEVWRHELISQYLIGQGHYSKAVTSLTLVPDHHLKQMKTSSKARIAHCEITPFHKLQRSTQSTVLSRLEAIRMMNHLHGKNPYIRSLPDGSRETITIMRKVGDMSLGNLIHKHKSYEIRLPIDDIIKIVKNCWLALIEQIHNKPDALVHGDIKPDNMTISLKAATKYQVFIVDPNSIAKSGQSGERIPFTDRYAAPERYEHDYKTHQTFDVYCMGMSLLELFGVNLSNADLQIYDALQDYTLPEVIRIKMNIYFDQVLEIDHTGRLSSAEALTHWQSIAHEYQLLQQLNSDNVNSYLEQIKWHLDDLSRLPLTDHIEKVSNLHSYQNLLEDALSLAERPGLSLTLSDIEQKIGIKLKETGDYRLYLPRLVVTVASAISFISDFGAILASITILDTVTFFKISDLIKARLKSLEPYIIECRYTLATRKLNIPDLTAFEMYWNNQHTLCYDINLLKAIMLMLTAAEQQSDIKSALYHYMCLILNASKVVESDLVILALAKDPLIDDTLKDNILNCLGYEPEILVDAIHNDFYDEFEIDLDVEASCQSIQTLCASLFDGELDYSNSFRFMCIATESPPNSPQP